MVNGPTRIDEIVTTAIDLAEDRGVHRVTTAHLARRLGFTEAALYRYFPGKGAILAAALQRLGDSIFVEMGTELSLQAAEAAGDPARQMTHHIGHFAERQGLLLELLVSSACLDDAAMHEAANAFIQEYAQRVMSFFEQLQMDGRLDGVIGAEELGRMWLCQLLGGYVRCRIGRDTWSPTDQPGFRAFIEMLKARSRHAAPAFAG